MFGADKQVRHAARRDKEGGVARPIGGSTQEKRDASALKYPTLLLGLVTLMVSTVAATAQPYMCGLTRCMPPGPSIDPLVLVIVGVLAVFVLLFIMWPVGRH